MIADGPLAIHAVVLHATTNESWLGNARDRDLRASVAAGVIELVSGLDERCIIVFPAAFLCAELADAAFGAAESMLGIARQNRAALAFGVRVGKADPWAPLDEPPQTLGFVADGGRRVAWPSDDAEPVSVLRGRRIAVLFGNELFDRKRREKIAIAKPEAIVVVTSVGPNSRWEKALRQLRTMAPTIVVGESLGQAIPGWAAAPEGWVRRDLSTSPSLTLVRYEPLVTPATLHRAFAGVGEQPSSMKD